MTRRGRGHRARRLANPYFNDEKAAKYAREQLWSSDTLLVGRKTYEDFAANWPPGSDSQIDNRKETSDEERSFVDLRDPGWGL
jgi:hypothetical protein